MVWVTFSRKYVINLCKKVMDITCLGDKFRG